MPIIPLNVAEELNGAREYFRHKERCVFCDLIRQEREDQVRLVAENDEFVTLCPFAPRFPFETWILPKNHGEAFEQMTHARLPQSGARAARHPAPPEQGARFAAVQLTSFTRCPIREPEDGYYHWHLEIMPKLTKVAGFEWGTGFYINPTPPEDAARHLRDAWA